MKKLTLRQIKAFMADEAKGSRTYRRLGLNSMANDEARHHEFFVREYNKLLAKRK